MKPQVTMMRCQKEEIAKFRRQSWPWVTGVADQTSAFHPQGQGEPFRVNGHDRTKPPTHLLQGIGVGRGRNWKYWNSNLETRSKPQRI
ncbi:hypothetical protein L6164_022374 [Bauhinia variegata]|uniref:Uncharacterized protein n=1 Tax=Bauhinia variegata TaxID=167791 RepID=A0ACB9MF30_BAUVA|nr:hypothetical protein L6164_022374 [Bauhinia variegata]